MCVVVFFSSEEYLFQDTKTGTLNTVRRKKKVTPFMHISFFKMRVYIPHFITDNYWIFQRECKQLLTFYPRLKSYWHVNSSSSDYKQKKPNWQTCIQNKSKDLSGCMKISTGWKCFYWVRKAMEKFFLFSCWFPPLMIPQLNHSWMLSTQYKWVIAKTSIKMLQ